VTETTNIDAALLPERHPQQDLFVCDVGDAVLKDIMQHMEHPFYSLSKKPETRVRRYEHNGHWVEITPSVKGQATIYDKDILIYSISQIMAKLNRGEEVSKRVRITSRDLLMFTNRGTSGRDYTALAEAIDRLAGTRISTNIKVGGEEQYDNFGLIDAASIRRKNGLDGRLLWCEVTLSDWVFNAIRANEVLALHPDYFRLRKPLERRVYELARKHCGQQAQWSIALDKLLKKSGSQSPMKRFRQMIKELAVSDHLPDYSVTLDDDDIVQFSRKEPVEVDQAGTTFGIPPLRPDTYDEARAAAPGWDIYLIEQEWREWSTTAPRDPDSAFVAFCQAWYARRGLPA
ncbi:MAG: replication initiator protein A, partial [Planctomycetales bacterium]|nr:replication initiator protein A [Planctomycetales bacterium]